MGDVGETATMSGPLETLDIQQGGPAARAALRSSVYAHFARAIAYPDQDFCERLRSGAIVEPLEGGLVALGPEYVAARPAWPDLPKISSGDDLAIEYTRLFDAGAGGPPCPLYGGLYGGARMKTMEEAVRFYNHFGLKLSQTPHEMPDHLATQLEFLHYLAYREAEALQRGTDAGPYQRAQRDFLERHPGAWIGKLMKRLEEHDGAAYFRALFGRLSAMLSLEGAALRAAHPQASSGTVPANGGGAGESIGDE
jgi:DMSO reductase family type II enzyme chaperone